MKGGGVFIAGRAQGLMLSAPRLGRRASKHGVLCRTARSNLRLGSFIGEIRVHPVE